MEYIKKTYASYINFKQKHHSEYKTFHTYGPDLISSFSKNIFHKTGHILDLY